MRGRSLATLSSLPFLVLLGCADAGDGGSPDEGQVDQSQDEIIGGAATSSYPAVGALTYEGEPFCTGTVIAARKVVTAAHCTVDFAANEVRFALGPNAYRPTAVLTVTRLQHHPNYDDQNLTDDIGLVTLGQDAPVAPAGVLGNMDAAFVGRSLTFVGYGVSNGRNQTGAGTKRAVTMPLSEVTATQFAYQQPGKNTCNGDSGGPAFYNQNGTLLVAGVTSYGDEYCQQYGVDTRVDPYLAFLGVAAGGGGVQPAPAPAPAPAPGAMNESEANNTRGTADPVAAASTVSGAIGVRGDLDYFRVVLPAGKTLTVGLTVPANLDYDLALYNSSGSKLAASENDAGQPEALSYRNSGASSKTLYLKVYGYNGAFSAGSRYQAQLSW